MEQAVFCIEKTTIATNKKRKIWKEKNKHSILTITFEKFVLNPWLYLKEIEEKLETKIGSKTNQMLRKQYVPRKVITDGPPFEIYKRCGWEPPMGGSEENELTKRRDMVANNTSSEALEVMDRLSQEYFHEYLS